ncbi:MAG: NAD-dependent epimerase/dehydratase family protein [Gemmatimonadales bacterium]
MTQRVLLTGGAGFIGSHVAEQYLAAGWEVTIVDNLSSGRRENLPAKATFVHDDIGSPVVRALLASGGFTVVNHHAAQMDVRVSVERPDFDAQVNLLGLLNLLEGARAGGVPRVVFASSGGVVYGESDALPHAEGARKLPVSPYGVSKLASEFYLAAYAQMYGLETVALRYANVYGPRQNPHGEAGVVAIFCNRLRRGSPITVYGDGAQTRDYVHVGDVARANVLAATCPVRPVYELDDRALNIGTGVETSVLGLAGALMTASGVRVPVTHAAARTGELARSAVAIDRAADWLDWRPECTLATGLEATWRWITTEA